MVISSTLISEQDARFSNLLQPIRDLTKNWDVDIAGNLEEYLDELEKVTVTFDGGLTTMNFTEAAMIIQGSACVYSKKLPSGQQKCMVTIKTVPFDYVLVLLCLHHMNLLKPEVKSGASEGDRVEFLYSLVYQVLDLLANKNKIKGKSSVDQDGNDEDANFDKDQDEEFLSLDDIQEHKNIQIKEDEHGCKSVQPFPQIPLSLLPLEEGEKGDNPLLSKKGEVLASRNDFRMNTSSVHHSGVLLLDLSHLTLLDRSPSFSAYVTVKSSLPDSSPTPMDDENDTDNMDLSENNSVNFDLMDKMDDAPPVTDAQPPPEELRNATEQPLPRTRNVRKIINPEPKPVIDPWEPVDPHESGTKREFKKSKTWKVPEWIENDSTSNTKRKRKRQQATEKHQLLPLEDYLSGSYCNKSKMPKKPLKVTLFPELERQYWKEFKSRQSILSKRKKSLGREIIEELETEEAAQNEDNDFQGQADVEDDEDDDLNLISDKLFDAMENAMSDHTVITSSFSDNTALDNNNHIVKDYEELVRQHVEHYMSSAQEYANITELSQRVTEWENKVLPRLQEEEEHEPFDIKTYGSSVIDSLQKGSTKPFRNVVVSKPTYEVCRIFLATLMLANTTNVDICNREEMDKFDLKLLSTTRHFEQLEEYQAPSVSSKS